MSLTPHIWRKSLLMIMQKKNKKNKHQMTTKKMHHMEFKRNIMKKQMQRKMKVILKYSPRSGGMFPLILTM